MQPITQTQLIGSLPGSTTQAAPEIHAFIPENNPTGAGLIIFPGGGYDQLMDHEGAGYANYFAQQGIACFVVTYRLAAQNHRHPAMIEDAYAALHTVRQHAAAVGIDPNKLGVCGSSAGGHLAACTLVQFNRYPAELALRPAFGVLCYPVILSSGAHINQGTFDNLLGTAPDPELIELMACEKQVSAQTPPCFIWSTSEDVVVPVENSLAFVAALSRNKVPYDLHIYDQGKHGLGLNTPYQWEKECVRWIKKIVT